MMRSSAEMMPRVTLGEAPRFKRVPDGDDLVADARVGRRAELCGREVRGTLDTHERDIGVGETADHVSGILGAVVERHAHRLGACNHVRVGQDVAFRADDDARPGTRVRGGRRRRLVGVDGDHRRLGLREQCLDVETARPFEPTARGRGRCSAVAVEREEEPAGDDRGNERAARGDDRDHVAPIALRWTIGPRVRGKRRQRSSTGPEGRGIVGRRRRRQHRLGRTGADRLGRRQRRRRRHAGGAGDGVWMAPCAVGGRNGGSNAGGGGGATLGAASSLVGASRNGGGCSVVGSSTPWVVPVEEPGAAHPGGDRRDVGA